jgi:hypothetical protein
MKKLASLLIVCGTLGANDEIAEIRKQIEELSKRLELLEKKSLETKPSGAAPTEPANVSKGTLELSSADTVIGLGGRIELRSIYASPEGDFAAGKIPLDNDADRGEGLSTHARESRLWVKSRTPTPYGPLRALVEVDFMGSEGSEANTNGHGPRLRHAYLQLGGWTIGQTNSAFNSLVALDTISLVINDTMVRQPLVMYTFRDETEWMYDLSFEQPETTLIDQNGVIITPKDDRFPDVVARVRYYPGWGEASLALMGRYIFQDEAKLSDGRYVDSADSAWGYGANLSARIKTFAQDDLRFDLQYGRGVGRYFAYNAFAAGSIDDAGNIRLQESYGAHIGYRHFWTSTLRSTLAYGYAATKNRSDIVSDKANKKATSLQANLLWSPFANALAGVEYARAEREVESGEKGTLEMGMLVFRYDF